MIKRNCSVVKTYIVVVGDDFANSSLKSFRGGRGGVATSHLSAGDSSRGDSSERSGKHFLLCGREKSA
jgi:hypothetical protein